MAQAKVLTEKEVKKVVKLIDSKRHASRNRCMFLLTHGTGSFATDVVVQGVLKGGSMPV